MTFFIKLLGERSVRLRVDAGAVLTIGRAPDTDLCIEESLVSRRHCELEGASTGLIVRDLGSRNGTKLNGERLRGEAFARPGDQIKVGTSHLLVERKEPSLPQRKSTAALRDAARRLRLPDLPGYEVLEQLGQGSTGHVYRARPTDGGPHVAIKLLKARAPRSTAERFLRSAETLARVDHPGVVRVHAVVDDGPQPFYVMELLDRAGTLAELIRNGPLGAREALSIGSQLARALEVIHAQGIVHRDLAPKHVMVLHGGVAKLVGFDFAKDVSRTDHAQLGDFVGELSYISPEQARDPRDVGPRSDLYSLGAILFHGVTGRRLFEGERLLAFRQVLSERPPRLRELVPSVSEGLDAIVAKLLEKEPEDRHASGAELERAFNAALLDACPPPPKELAVYDPRADGDDDTRRVRDESSTHTDLPAVTGTNSFGGGFSGLELLEIAHFLELQQKEGRLLVSTPAVRGQIHLRRGLIVHAEADGAFGEAAARRLLEAQEGTFAFHGLADDDETVPDDERRVSIRPSTVTLEVMRLRDEAARA